MEDRKVSKKGEQDLPLSNVFMQCRMLTRLIRYCTALRFLFGIHIVTRELGSELKLWI
jgi:hypothetical protein